MHVTSPDNVAEVRGGRGASRGAGRGGGRGGGGARRRAGRVDLNDSDPDDPGTGDAGGGNAGPGGGPGPGPAPTGGPGSRMAKKKADDAAKNEVRLKLASGEYGILLIDEGNPNQSEAWRKFGRVVDRRNNDKPLNFVQCRNDKCGTVKMLTCGRGNLAAHNCTEQLEVARPVVVPQDDDLRAFHMSLAGMCAGKLIPPTLADAEEFRGMIQLALDIGAKCGNVDVGTIMPCANSLRTTVKDGADKARGLLVEKFKEDMQDGLCSGTVDGWDGGGLRKRKFFTQTLSTISEDWVMHDNILFTALCDAESVTSPIIREALDENMAQLTLPLEKVRVIVVLGGGGIIFLSNDNLFACICEAP